MDTAVDTTVLTILGAAFGVMFATMTTLMFVSIRVQHRDSTQIRTEMRDLIGENRDLIERSSKENRDLIGENRYLIERSSKENRDLIERSAARLSGEFAEHKRLTDANHRAVQEQLGDVRDRLGRIEGHLGIGVPPQPDDDDPSGPQVYG